MHWITAGFGMFFSSVGVYLLIRRASLDGMSVPVQNLASFLPPFLLFLVMALATGTPLAVDWYQGLILVVSAVFFSYLGSKWSLLGMKYAPNPGYSLVIAKSYVVFTTLFALVVFGSPVTAGAAAAIALIITGSALVMVEPGSGQQKARPVWLVYSVLAFFCWGMLAVSSKYLLDLGVPIAIRLAYVTGIVTGIILLEMKRQRIPVISAVGKQAGMFAAIGVMVTAFNYFMQAGYQTAPNVGYINAMNAASIGLVTVGSVVLFHDNFSLRKFTGVVVVITGLVVLVM